MPIDLLSFATQIIQNASNWTESFLPLISRKKAERLYYNREVSGIFGNLAVPDHSMIPCKITPTPDLALILKEQDQSHSCTLGQTLPAGIASAQEFKLVFESPRFEAARRAYDWHNFWDRTYVVYEPAALRSRLQNPARETVYAVLIYRCGPVPDWRQLADSLLRLDILPLDRDKTLLQLLQQKEFCAALKAYATQNVPNPPPTDPSPAQETPEVTIQLSPEPAGKSGDGFSAAESGGETNPITADHLRLTELLPPVNKLPVNERPANEPLEKPAVKTTADYNFGIKDENNVFQTIYPAGTMQTAVATLGETCSSEYYLYYALPNEPPKRLFFQLGRPNVKKFLGLCRKPKNLEELNLAVFYTDNNKLETFPVRLPEMEITPNETGGGSDAE